MIFTIALGVVLGLAIWNFPYVEAFGFIYSVYEKRKFIFGLVAFVAMLALLATVILAAS